MFVNRDKSQFFGLTNIHILYILMISKELRKRFLNCFLKFRKQSNKKIWPRFRK